MRRGVGTTIFPMDDPSSRDVRTRMRTKIQKLTPIQIKAGGIAGLVYPETVVVLDEPLPQQPVPPTSAYHASDWPVTT